MKWTPNAEESALRAQPEFGDDIVVAAIERAEEIASLGGFNLVDTDIWFQALADVRLSGLEGEQGLTEQPER